MYGSYYTPSNFRSIRTYFLNNATAAARLQANHYTGTAAVLLVVTVIVKKSKGIIFTAIANKK